MHGVLVDGDMEWIRFRCFGGTENRSDGLPGRIPCRTHTGLSRAQIGSDPI